MNKNFRKYNFAIQIYSIRWAYYLHYIAVGNAVNEALF